MKNTLTADDIDLLVTDSAIRQIKLMKDHDYTLEGLEFRMKIGGKGCGGFTYDTGFSEIHPEDIIIRKSFPQIDFELVILMDPFSAFYTQKGSLDYLLDPQSNTEGFVVENANEGEHKGKFYKDTSKLPPWAQV